jgi:hypothetical protein
MALFFASSDARQRYAEDVLTVVAMPEGGVFQFRYDSRYVSTDVHALIASGDIAGKQAIVAFVGRVETVDAFVMPIRIATVLSAEEIAEALVFRFRADQFPDLSSWARDKQALEAQGRVVLDQMSSRYGKYYPVMARHDGLIVDALGSGTSEWNEVTSRLARLDTFANSYFARISIGSPDKGGNSPKFRDGALVVRGTNPFVLKCWFYRADYLPDSRRIALSCDDSVLDVFSDASYAISSRYDDVEFWLSPLGTDAERRTLLQIVIPGTTSAGDLSTRVQVRTIVESPLAPKARRAVVGGVAAAFVALPAILGPDTSLALRLVFALIGALMVSWLAVVSSTRK